MNCWDNAIMKRFFGNLKRSECTRKHRKRKTRPKVKKDLFVPIEWFYNTARWFAALPYQSQTPSKRNAEGTVNVRNSLC